jgi:hypothetical protein
LEGNWPTYPYNALQYQSIPNWFEASMLDPSMNDEEKKIQITQRNTCRHIKRNIWRCNIEID